MERIALIGPTLHEAVGRAAKVLAASGAIIFPTDTLYGLGADAFSDVAVDAIYAIKGRDYHKPIHCVVSGMEMAARYAEIAGGAEVLANEFFPGPLTLILPKKPEIHGGIARDLNTIGIRVPHNHFCIELARAFDRPFTATSANRTGEIPPRSAKEVLAQLGKQRDLVELLVDGGTLHPSPPSTVVDLSQARPVILREGAIPPEEIWNALRIEL